ncbi:sodium:proton antiporter [Roseimaritima sediminicola]|uniref:sodium:proton antiporter n=1 Tax=Roseimaritima sediminicola TaxID=2662066 RepID=UPI0012983EE3|nr:cation:proton antiporter subunit C [Roseimaritima sediminicola]
MSLEQFLGLYNYWIVIFLMMTGFYIVISRGNLIRSIIGLNIFQTSVFLLYITMGKISGGTAPIIPPALAAAHSPHDEHTLDAHGEHALNGHSVDEPGAAAGEPIANGAAELAEHVEEIAEPVSAAVTIADGPIYSNPLPSVLMLTAIVVGIATTAVALALIVRIREDYGTIEEDEILAVDRRS